MKKCLLAVSTICLCLSALARIGEPKAAMEARLFSKVGTALEYDLRQFREREAFELPYRNLLLIFPRETHNAFYFKRPDGKAATSPDVVKQDALNGWELHVCYYKNVSVMEFYRRRGEPMQHWEVAALMHLMQGEGLEWVADKGKAAALNDELAAEFSKSLGLLPKAKVRTVFLEVSDDIKRLPEYNHSIRNRIVIEEQRKAFELYRNRNAPPPDPKKKTDKKQDDKKTAGAKNTSTEDEASINYGEIAKDVADKIARIEYNIPAEEDTALGYTLRLSDGSVRAKLYNDGILFIDSRFDRLLRDELEGLFKYQNAERFENSKTSVLNF